jgi:hypothetical protein
VGDQNCALRPAAGATSQEQAVTVQSSNGMKNRMSVYLIVAISLVVAALHFLIGPDYQGFLKHFIRGYLIDIVLPMNLYLLLQISLRKKLAVSTARLTGAVITFCLGTAAEILQMNGVPFLGKTYDPLDILMYGIGVGAGVILDLTIINKFEKKKHN